MTSTLGLRSIPGASGVVDDVRVTAFLAVLAAVNIIGVLALVVIAIH